MNSGASVTSRRPGHLRLGQRLVDRVLALSLLPRLPGQHAMGRAWRWWYPCSVGGSGAPALFGSHRVASAVDSRARLPSFAAIAAHDLRSPLAAVKRWIEVAEKVMESDPKIATETLERGRHANDRMSQEIEDWLTTTSAARGCPNPSRSSCSRCLTTGEELPGRGLRGVHPRLRDGRPDAAPAPAGQPGRQRGHVRPAGRTPLGDDSQLLRRRPRMGSPLRRRRRRRHRRGRAGPRSSSRSGAPRPSRTPTRAPCSGSRCASATRDPARRSPSPSPAADASTRLTTWRRLRQ